MTQATTSAEHHALVEADAPAERLAAFRILSGLFALGYLLARLPVFLQLGRRDAADFSSVGLAQLIAEPVGRSVVTLVVVVAIAAGVGFVVGAWFRLSGPLFAVAMLMLCTYRSSWGQLLHFENLMVLHLLVVSVAASADVWSVDARRRRRRPHRSERPDYATPLRLACIVVVITYVVAGVAKLRYGGLGWVDGDTLRNHVAYTAARLDLLGGEPSPLARPFVERAWLAQPLAVGAVAIELLAPIALLGGRYRTIWVTAAWAMHAGIAALMLIVFPYPLFLVAFAPFFPLERCVAAVRARFASEV